MFDPNSILEPKGKAIGEFSYLEHLINVFIATHYVGTLGPVFSEEILEDDYFNFELKKRILHKLLKKYHPTVWDQFPRKALNDLQMLRNRIVHGALAARPGLDGKIHAIFRHQGKDFSIEETFSEWKKNMTVVHPATSALPGVNSQSENIEVV